MCVRNKVPPLACTLRGVLYLHISRTTSRRCCAYIFRPHIYGANQPENMAHSHSPIGTPTLPGISSARCYGLQYLEVLTFRTSTVWKIRPPTAVSYNGSIIRAVVSRTTAEFGCTCCRLRIEWGPKLTQRCGTRTMKTLQYFGIVRTAVDLSIRCNGNGTSHFCVGHEVLSSETRCYYNCRRTALRRQKDCVWCRADGTVMCLGRRSKAFLCGEKKFVCFGVARRTRRLSGR